MIEEYTVRFLDAAAPALSAVLPLYYVGSLLGLINVSIFYMFFGRGLRLFPPYLALGIVGALLGLTAGTQLGESGPLLGDVHVAATGAGTWTILLIARSLRL